jgi:probable phosphoglycerate mutase
MIYLVRHGQTAFNLERRLQGHVDSELTPLGLAQAAAVGELLAGLAADDDGPPWRLVSSPLGRARRTADIIGRRLGLAVETEPRLIELSWGDWDGRLRIELEARHPDAFADSGWAFRASAGESFEAVAARMADWLASLPPEPERRVVAVSHGVAGRVLRGVYAGLSREATISQDVPQDAVFRLAGGAIARIEGKAPARA